MPDPIQIPAPEFLRRKDAAKFISMSVAFLRKAEREGRGPRMSRLGKSPVYSVADLRDWVASRCADRSKLTMPEAA
jgi:predicted DNA-binding transcriptional regulator AlpA